MSPKEIADIILYEDNHLIVVNKPAGFLVQGDRTGDLPLGEYVKNYIKEKYNKPGKVYLGIPHRIDRPVSGVLVFTRTSKALERMTKQFREKQVQKTYWAVVKKQPTEAKAVLVHHLVKNQKQNKSYANLTPQKNTKSCELSYEYVRSSDNYHLLKVLPKTGRHHQIRVQLSAIGSPIKGDIKYGAARTNKDASIHLHARQIDIIHPVQKTPLTITAPVPKHDAVWQYFAKEA